MSTPLPQIDPPTPPSGVVGAVSQMVITGSNLVDPYGYPEVMFSNQLVYGSVNPGATVTSNPQSGYSSIVSTGTAGGSGSLAVSFSGTAFAAISPTVNYGPYSTQVPSPPTSPRSSRRIICRTA